MDHERVSVSKEEILSHAKMVSLMPAAHIYFLIDGDEIVYVGQSVNVELRILSHINEGVKQFDRYAIVECNETLLDEIEAHLIVKFCPKYNQSLPNGCTYVSQHHVRKSVKSKRALTRAINRLNIQPVWGNYYDPDDAQKLIVAANT